MAAKKAVKKRAKGKQAAPPPAASEAAVAPRGRGKKKPSEGSAPMAPTAPKKQWNLRLYVAGDSPRSRTALANLQKLCETRLKDNYDIEVIDLTKRPDLAKADQILAVPTLIRSVPEPMKRIIGDLSNADRALVALDLDTEPLSGHP
jgi:circadian clock protein KaiB